MSILLLLISSELTSMILQTSPQTKLVSQTNNYADVIINDVLSFSDLHLPKKLDFPLVYFGNCLWFQPKPKKLTLYNKARFQHWQVVQQR